MKERLGSSQAKNQSNGFELEWEVLGSLPRGCPGSHSPLKVAYHDLENSLFPLTFVAFPLLAKFRGSRKPWRKAA